MPLMAHSSESFRPPVTQELSKRDFMVLKVWDLEPAEWQTLRLSGCFFSSAAEDCTSNRWSWCASPLTESCMNLSLCLWYSIITWWLAIIVQGRLVSHHLCARTCHNPPTSATPTPLSRASFGSKCATCPSKMNSAYPSVLYQRLNNNFLAQFPLDPNSRETFILTSNERPWVCDTGIRWMQLRMPNASPLLRLWRSGGNAGAAWRVGLSEVQTWKNWWIGKTWQQYGHPKPHTQYTLYMD